MRILTVLCVLALSSFLMISCQKDLTFETPVSDNSGNSDQGYLPGSTLYRIQQGIDPDLTEDTVYLISYNAQGKMSQIIDSLYQDTLKITYDADNRLSGSKWSSGDYTNFKYNSSKLLEEINFIIAGTIVKYVYEYTNGVISKGSEYSDHGLGGAPVLAATYQYTVTSGNVSNLKVFNINNALVYEESFSYGTELNPVRDLALLNTGNYLGMFGLTAGNIAAFNKNIYKNSSVTSGSFNSENTFNSHKQPTKVRTLSPVPGNVKTWQFYYK